MSLQYVSIRDLPPKDQERLATMSRARESGRTLVTYSPGSFFPLDFHHPFTTRLPLRLAPYVNASGELVMEEMLCCLVDLLGCSWQLLSNLTGRFDIESLCAHQAPDPDVMLFKHGLDLRLKAWSTNPCVLTDFFGKMQQFAAGIRGRLQAHSTVNAQVLTETLISRFEPF